MAGAIDFGSLRLLGISADGDEVAVLLTARSAGGDELWMTEHWTLRDGKIGHLRVFYFDARLIQ
jgi:hypothetical protein